MGRFLTLLTGGMALAPCVLAGQVSIGARAGLNITSVSGEEVQDIERLTGLHVGGLVALPLSEAVSLELGAAWSPKGANLAFDEEGTARADVRLGYIDFPVHLRVEVAESDNLGLHVIGGPTISYNHSCEIAADVAPISGTVPCDDPVFEGDEIEPAGLDYGVSLGGGISVAAGDSGARLVADLLYGIGLEQIVDGDDAKNRAVSFLAGFRIPLG